MVELYLHNQIAYQQAVLLLQQEGKACITHPTGSGKSFIGFKLCEEYHDKQICWLSPSEYIFQTQLENLTSSGADLPQNIAFFTYAKMMLLTDQERADIKPDYIILDEFHRCGAQMWGQGVERLLQTYPDVPILGLSATHIRYLDNQRNMADELFDGNVASEMALGEAIVRGILPAPTYVTTLFGYQQELEKYQRKINAHKSKQTRDQAEQYLEALRRTLEKAEGLDEIFQKHIPKKDGKYLVFCANKEHLDEMMTQAKSWFSKVDEQPHTYIAYADDPETDQSFADFKADQSTHLKLLFCIDMLNEGIHVEGVSGVVLLRPTISPIIYKQQIGRALSTSKNTTPIIFDVVNNFENLYAIGAIEQEMQTAIQYFRSNQAQENIVTEQFAVIEELRECRALFDQLNDTLTTSWEQMYQSAVDYHKQHGDLNVPKAYKTAEGYSLGMWLVTQRRVRSGEVYGRLDERKIQLLDDLGMRWDNFLELSWNKNYELAKAYYDMHGDLDIYIDYQTEHGVKLGAWICRNRQQQVTGNLSAEREQQLNKIGMIWDKLSYLWEQGYQSALGYYLNHGDLNAPANFADDSGYKLGAWLNVQKRLYRTGALSQQQVERLNLLSMQWLSKFEVQWNNGFAQAEAYFKQNGHLKVPHSYQSSTGFKLGAWVDNNREHAIKISKDRKEKLDSIGMIWQKTDPWEERYQLAKEFYEQNGHLNVPAGYTPNGIWLNKWLNEQKQIYRGKRVSKALTNDQIMRLEVIQMEWRNVAELNWDNKYVQAKSMFILNENIELTTDHNLKVWLRAQRKAFAENKLTTEQIQKLDQIQFQWKTDDRWEQNFQRLCEYKAKHGNLEIESTYTTPEGINLKVFLNNQKSLLKHNGRSKRLSQEQVTKLLDLGLNVSQSRLRYQDLEEKTFAEQL